ncbi:MAG: 2,3-diketo-L-gulonate transporter small permease protein YiaM [Pseudomonadota bacterium]|jgi:TRAP-type C4-dicarboxylate transport system permease small subunit
MLTSLLNTLGRCIDALLALALAVMVVLVFGNVVLRYGFNSGITTSEELSRWLFVWLTFLGAIVAMKDGAHLGTDALVSRLGRRGKRVLFVIGHVLMLYVCGLLFQGSLELVRINLSATSAVMQVSMGWFYAPGLVLAVLGGLVLINNLWRLRRGQVSDAELIGVRESEEEPVDAPPPVAAEQRRAP